MLIIAVKIVLKEQNVPRDIQRFILDLDWQQITIVSLKRITKAFKDEFAEFNKQFTGEFIR